VRGPARPALAALALAAAALAACAGRGPETDRRPVVLVTVAPQAFVVERIAGGLARVETVLPAAADPHHHEPTLDQLRAVSSAALWVKVGHPGFSFEKAWLDRLLAEAPDLRVVDGSAGAELIADDAHVWLSPRHAASLARNVAGALAELRPESAGAIDARLGAFLADVDALEAEIGATLAPARGRWFLVVHPAWGYLAREHGLEQVAIEAGGRQPDPRRLADLIARARASDLQVLFTEPQFDDQAARTIAGEVGARIEALDPLAPDWDDNLRRVAAALAKGSVP
jgi:zinc transport system substrate-binding protein